MSTNLNSLRDECVNRWELKNYDIVTKFLKAMGSTMLLGHTYQYKRQLHIWVFDNKDERLYVDTRYITVSGLEEVKCALENAIARKYKSLQRVNWKLFKNYGDLFECLGPQHCFMDYPEVNYSFFKNDHFLLIDIY